ncbi:hypothetical protein Glove_212g56 [Diversispora epigaea]|uniref:Uncharacterized protein n=1 Tax=Diversispora epigaea TaxID=1348612 RepID=A0A397IIB8_9GLOM|nr:hypothetical protein Glove_212g56 [Diversispora epigaea]
MSSTSQYKRWNLLDISSMSDSSEGHKLRLLPMHSKWITCLHVNNTTGFEHFGEMASEHLEHISEVGSIVLLGEEEESLFYKA